MFKISAIICTYNRDKFLKSSLESLVTQTLAKELFEIIVVDNNSTDNTREVYDTIVRNNPDYNFVYIKEEKQGLSYARNTGWKSARSPYVYYLDDDGKASEGLLEEYLKLFAMKEKVAACGGKIKVEYDPAKPNWLPPFFERFYGDYCRGESICECEYVPGGNSAWSVEFLKESGGFAVELGRVGQDGAGCEESLLNARALKMGYTLIYSPNALMLHYAGDSRLNLKWLFQRMKGQGKSAAKLILMQSDNKRHTAKACIKVEVKQMIKLLLPLSINHSSVKQEIIARTAFMIERFFKLSSFINFLFKKK